MNEERIEAYLEKVPPCVEGQGGDDHLFRVACLLRQRFSLDEEQIFEWLKHFNEKCQPPWGEDRLAYKAGEAVKARLRIEGVRPPASPTQKTIFLRKPRLEDYQSSIKCSSQATDATAFSNIMREAEVSTWTKGLEVHVASVAEMEALNAPVVSPYGCLALDIETYAEPRIGKSGKVLKSKEALSAQKGEIRLLTQISESGGTISIRDLRERPLSEEERTVLETRELLAHNVAFELRFLGTKYAVVASKVFCTMTASKLLHPGRGYSHKLGDVLERHLDVVIPKDLGSSDWGAMLLTEEQMEYARNDVRYLRRLKKVLEQELKKANLEKVFEMESQLILVIADMEIHGFAVDVEEMARMRGRAESGSLELADEVRRLLGDPNLNPASPAQIVKAFQKANVGVSDSDEETLKRLNDPRAEAILAFRGAAKLASNIQSLLESVHDGRIHSTFQPFGTTTGRFSSKDPNLQNVTKGALRSCFIPSDPGKRLIVADYSQIELRVAAHIANDEVMLKAFQDGEDLHMKIVQEIYNGKATKEDRHKGKAINFGFVYGQGVEGFVRYARTKYDLELTFSEAEQFRGRFFGLYTGLAKWHSSNWKKVHDGVNASHTVFGRRLLADSDGKWQRFTMLTNYVVQGSCADLIKLAMLRCSELSMIQLLATVHDELIFEAPEGVADQYCVMVRHAMIGAFEEMFGLDTPVEVDAKVCNNWGDK